MVMPPNRNLVDALGNRFVPLNAFAEDLRVPHHYNRLRLHKANQTTAPVPTEAWSHTPSGLAAVFFRMA